MTANSCKLMCVLAAIAIASAAVLRPSHGQAPDTKPLSVEWTLAKTQKPLEREALLTVTNSQGQPVSGATIEINVDMPSMPMMHKVPKSTAEPAGEAGRYKARFTLEMAGEWAAQIEVKQPVRTKVIKKFNVD